MMVRKFVPADSRPSLVDVNIKNTRVIRIPVEWMTGKANRLSPILTVIENMKI